MAYNSRTTTEKLAWMTLKSDDDRLPEELRQALDALEEIKDQIEDLVRQAKPAPKGRKWMFAYKHGVGIALAEVKGNTTSYFD